MEHKELLEQLAKLGFPLFGPEEVLDANRVLAEVVKSGNVRLWEGFPVVLAKAAENGLFNYELAIEYLKDPRQKALFLALTSMSLDLYEVLGLKFFWVKGFDRFKNDSESYAKYLSQDKDFKLGDFAMSGERLKATFNNYFHAKVSDLSDLLSMKEEVGLEYALSQVFPPKQRELFLKKLKNEKMTKTEREYYYRVVKKKLVALSNTKLHELARKAL